MADQIVLNYQAFYDKRKADHVYPVEFVVRAFLGNYPRLSNRDTGYPGTRVLDLGFGDGRNMPLLANLGMEVHGVEIAAEICAQTGERLARLGTSAQLRVGRNRSIPYEGQFFDHVLACHACYYVDPGTSFNDNVIEISRVVKPGGRLVCSLPIGTSYIFAGSKDLGSKHMEIKNDPYGVRNGYVLKKFDSESEIVSALGEKFSDFQIGSCRNDFWGIEEHVWTVACHRSS